MARTTRNIPTDLDTNPLHFTGRMASWTRKLGRDGSINTTLHIPQRDAPKGYHGFCESVGKLNIKTRTHRLARRTARGNRNNRFEGLDDLQP